MKSIARLFAGQIALWCTFWLIGTPLALIWDGTGACMVTGCGIEQSALANLVIAVFALTTIVLPFVCIAIWRSASNYRRTAFWHTPVAIAAKCWAVFVGAVAVLSVLGLLYLGYDFIEALLAPA